jgi:hypothetical protein
LKRVAIIAPDFTPSSLPPALRVRYFASHLPAFGWEPIIITTHPRHYEQPVDLANEQLLPPGLRVIRTEAVSPRFTRRVGFGDLGIRSLRQHWQALTQLHRAQKLDALLIPVPPFVPMILGRLAYQRLNIPYVLDYIDPWRTDYFKKLPKNQRPAKWRFADALAGVLEPLAVRHAAHLIAVSQGTNDMVIANYPGFPRERTTEIPYGGEQIDADFIRQHPRPNTIFTPDDGLLHLSSTGHFNPVLRHAAEAFFDAVRLGLERNPDLFRRLRVHFVGTTYAANAADAYQVLPIVREKGVEAFVSEHPERLSYLESLQIMADSHSLLMLGNPSPHYTASKVFPYILSKRPILALFHEQSSVVRILAETQAGESVSFSAERPLSAQVEAIYDKLLALISLPAGWQPLTRWDAFQQYSTRAMTERLAHVLDRIS